LKTNRPSLRRTPDDGPQRPFPTVGRRGPPPAQRLFHYCPLSLFLVTFLTSLLLLALGGLLVGNPKATAAFAHRFPRSVLSSYFTMGLATAWFLYHVAQLGEADFGAYRGYLFLGFLAVAVLSFVHVKDFLAVRGLAILALLSAWVVLTPAYLQEPASRLFLVGLVYLWIVLALYVGVLPYRLRDFFQWLFATDLRPKVLGGLLLGYGVLLQIVAFTYPG